MEQAFLKNPFLTPKQLLQHQILNKHFYEEASRATDQCDIKFESLEQASTTLFQYFNGQLMAFDFTPYVDCKDIISQVKKAFSRKELCWQPLSPNDSTSSLIQQSLYFGRAIYLPMPKTLNRALALPSRVIVISGCTNKQNTNLNCTDVQEWNLNDMTVRMIDPLKLARTSFACYHLQGDRYIYVLGGNHTSNQPINDVQRLDIYSKKWEKLPSMLEPRANASSLIPRKSDYLYAFGGYNNNFVTSAVVSSIERLELKDLKLGWKFLELKLNTEVKACNYMHYISETEILIFGGWSHGNTSTAVDRLDLGKLDFIKWGDKNGVVQLKSPDMITKPVLQLGQFVLAVQGRKYIHFLDLKNQIADYILDSGEDKAESESLARLKITKASED